MPLKTRKVVTKTAGSAAIDDAQIAVRAYERWMGRGCPVSDGFEDWIAARSELEAENGGTRASKGPARRAPLKAKAAHPSASIH